MIEIHYATINSANANQSVSLFVLPVSAFLSRSTNSRVAKVTGSKVNRGGGYGLEIPCKYTFRGPKNYIDKLKAIYSK